MLSISWFVYMCLFVCLFTFEVPFNSLLVPTCQCPISKILWNMESLGKSNGEKGSQIWKLLLKQGVKLRRQKEFFTIFFLLLFTLFKHLFAPTSQSPMSNFLDFWNPWRKVMERKGLWFENFKLMKGVKWPRKKKKNSANFALLAGFFWY